MSQAIIFTNDNGGVSVCIPTGELFIEEVLVKDCPLAQLLLMILFSHKAQMLNSLMLGNLQMVRFQ